MLFSIDASERESTTDKDMLVYCFNKIFCFYFNI